MDEINKAIEEKLNGDTEFQSSLESLSEEDKSSTIESRRKEMLEDELKGLREKALDAEKHKKSYEDQKIRAEKAEADLKKKPIIETKDGLTTRDAIVLAKANIPDEDIDDVIDYAKFKGISVVDALKSPVVTATLAQKTESRRVANATQIRSTRSQNVEVDGNSVIEDIKSKGENAVPEPGSKEAEAMFNARHRKMS